MQAQVERSTRVSVVLALFLVLLAGRLAAFIGVPAIYYMAG